MKTKVIFGISLLLIVLFCLNFIISNGNNKISTTPPSVSSNVFLIGALNMGWDHNYSSHLDSLCFNTWHNYLAGYYDTTIGGKRFPIPNGWKYIDASCGADYFQNPVSSYSGAVSTVINNIYAGGLGCRSLLSRPKMECLIRGQSSIYQCESPSNIPFDKFYSFDSSQTGRDVQDASYGNIWVKVCEPGIDPANAYVVKDVKSKYEQAGFNGQLDFFNDNFRYWYIKPKVRILANTPPNTEVFKIELISFKNDLVFSKTITAENFYDNNGIYNGNYIEEYFSNNSPTPFFVDGDTLKPNSGDNHFDVRIKWLGNCTMWIDYVKVENDIASKLFNPNPLLNYDNWISDESNQIGNTSGAYRFWVDEPTYNMLPAVKYVQNKLVNSYNANSSLLMTEYSCYHGPEGTNPNCYDQLIYSDYKRKQDSMKVSEIMTANYPLYGHSKVPYYLQNSQYDSTQGFLGTPAGLSEYEVFIQSIFDNNLIGNENGYIKGLTYPIRYLKETTPEKPFYFIPQVLMEYYHHGFENREPTTAEQEAMVDIAVSFGAKGILYYEYVSWNDFTHCTGNPGDSYATGIVDSIFNPLRINVYGEQKWNKLCALDSKLKTWGPTLMSFPITNINSYSYRLTSQRETLTSASYFNSATTFKPGGGTPICNDYSFDIPTGLTYDCQDSTFLQIATMKNSEPYTDYFMVVNRRCYPDSNSNNSGGARFVRVQFKSNYSSFSVFKNWNVLNVENNTIVGTFNSGVNSNIDLNWFKPGEGKLYKIKPVMLTGGSLVCNESFTEQTFTNDSIVNGNGYDITIGRSNTISFKSIGGIVMNGGTFRCGTKFSYQAVTLQGSNYWNGLELNGCDTVTIQNTTVKDIPYDSPVHLYGININDGNNIIVKNNTFNNNSNAGFLNINFIDTVTSTATYIQYNNIIGDYCSEGYSVNSNGGLQTQVYLQNNYFNSTGGGSGIMLNNIAGGVLSGNNIYNCYYGINLISSSVDVYGNTIINSENSKGIYSLSGSTANLSPSRSESGTEYVGGSNTISNLSSESNNIYVDNSYFYLDLGSNSFTIANENTNHHSGWFPQADDCEDATIKETYNCFYLDGNLVPKSNVTCGENGNLIDFDFSSQNPICQALYDQFDVIALAVDIYDSIPVKLGGNGGGLGFYKEGQAMSVQTSSFFKSLKDTIIINMRKHNYDLVITKSTQLLNLFPDSTFVIDAMSKLYYANLKLDNNGNKIGPLKTYFETLILNNQGNFSLIKRANYFIQKCKVVLKQYTSALQGFQEIINQNPYSFEGLVASWDYAATTLLANSSGGIKGDLQLSNNETSEESNVTLYSMIDTLRNRKVNAGTYTTDDFDKKVFTKKDRETLQNSVESMYKNERTKQINKLQELEKKSKSNIESISKKSKSELKIMKTLGEVVKVKKPNTMSEHIKNVRKDINKVLVVEKPIGNSKNNLIPQDYSLSQNFPNPFNPSTKINYELPKDGKVKLVIYDILGREMKSLVNNEFKTAGRYTVEFNGTQFASGVYFYRIQVEGGKGFTSVKKMVLVK